MINRMFWVLWFCHLIADYPLQTDALVQAKKRLPGLSWHVAIHLLTMLAVLGGLLKVEPNVAWAAAGAVAGLHFGIDWLKNQQAKYRPGWVIGPYLFDQLLHGLSLLAVAAWLTGPTSASAPAWVIYGSGYLLVSYVWSITERVLTYRQPAYRQAVGDQAENRMLSRAILYSALFFGPTVWGAVVLLVGLAFHRLDLAGPYRRRALLTDLAVVVVVMGLTGWVEVN